MTKAARRLLEGIRVLDMSMHLAGPYGSMLLADMGAEVIKVEPPHGDPLRLLDPLRGDVPVLWASVNRNKRSLVLDLHTPEGRQVLLDLVAKSDIVYNNFRPGVLSRLGLDLEALRSVNPGIILGNLSGYGQDGPRSSSPAYDTAVQGLAGVMSLTGHPGQAPARAGVPIADLGGGIFLALGVLAALNQRHMTGQGCELDISLFDTQISMLVYWAGIQMNLGIEPPPQGSGNSNTAPYGAYQTADGYVIVAIWSGAFWPKLCRALDLPDLADDPRFRTNADRVASRGVLDEIIGERFRQRSSGKWLEILEENDVPCGPVNSVGQAMRDEQTLARAMRVPVTIDGVTYEFSGNPIKAVGAEADRFLPPPRLAQHSREILRDIVGLSDAAIDELRACGAVGIEDPAHPRWRGVLQPAGREARAG
jgi:crotonobetainyl-CoA:carnitine CoA-transferase CaiB-like acyl-CoA transferase